MSSPHPKIEIKSIGGNGGTIYNEILIDGHKLRGVRRFKLEREVGNSIPTLTIDLNALNVSVDTPALLYQEGFSEMEINFK